MNSVMGFLLWYLFLSFLGLISFPIVYKTMPFLIDRGYILSRMVGLLVWAYVYWLLSSLGILSNGLSGAIFALFILLLISFLTFRNIGKNEIHEWFKSHIKIIFVTESLFLIAFAVWTLLRSFTPDILGTEKPMELAFINSISRSPTFPPNDPWLSGYAISYYYFGYVMVALLGFVTGTIPSISFNLAISAWFALTALGGYGIILNLLQTWHDQSNLNRKLIKSRTFIYSSLLGPFFLLIISNLEGFLEMLHAKGLFWQKNPDGSLTSKFWTWLNIQELNEPPSLPFTFMPNRAGGIWWWRASRVLQDFDVAGASKEIIDEFPFFSYFLSDLHPHVLAMPLGLLAIAIAINLFRGQKEYSHFTTLSQWIGNSLFWLIVLCFGGIVFANTWDLPIYFGITLITFLAIRTKTYGWNKRRLMEIGISAVIIVFFSLFLYLPFLIGFSSQAGGILPSLNFFTPGKNFWVMFYPFLIIIILFLLIRIIEINDKKLIFKSGFLCLSIVGLLFILSYGMAWLIGNLPNLVLFIQQNIGINLSGLSDHVLSLSNLFIGIHGGGTINSIIVASLMNRVSSPFALLTMVFLVMMCFSILISTFNAGKKEHLRSNIGIYHGETPIILLILMGSIFCLIPEFFYLRDVFGTRMNTIFKFYFQAWVVWSMAAASIMVILWNRYSHKIKVLLRISLISTLLLCCSYPFFGLLEKIRSKGINQFNLDGSAFIKQYDPNEYEAIQWLNKTSFGNISEAVGGSYSGFARISTHTGLPTILGWPGHEMQWRGGVKEIGNREEEVRLLYETNDWQLTSAIIAKYRIRYIYIGDLEKSTYRVNEKKFSERLQKVFFNASISIYETWVES